MVCYESEVHDEAVSFIEDNMDEVMSAIRDGEDRILDRLDTEFFESVTDRSYTTRDAAFVIDNSTNVEEDYGLWDGKNDPQEALQIQAAYTYSNDVAEKVQDIYDDIKEKYDDVYSEAYDDCEEKHLKEAPNDEDEYDPTEDAEEIASKIAEGYFEDEYKDEPEPVTDPKYQIDIIAGYLRAGELSCRSGYPCGGSYIDARCGTGFGNPDEYDYVALDHRVAKMIPQIRGMYKPDVKKYLDELIAKQ